MVGPTSGDQNYHSKCVFAINWYVSKKSMSRAKCQKNLIEIVRLHLLESTFKQWCLTCFAIVCCSTYKLSICIIWKALEYHTKYFSCVDLCIVGKTVSKTSCLLSLNEIWTQFFSQLHWQSPHLSVRADSLSYLEGLKIPLRMLFIVKSHIFSTKAEYFQLVQEIWTKNCYYFLHNPTYTICVFLAKKMSKTRTQPHLSKPKTLFLICFRVYTHYPYTIEKDLTSTNYLWSSNKKKCTREADIQPYTNTNPRALSAPKTYGVGDTGAKLATFS
jgi:hypothetical protein